MTRNPKKFQRFFERCYIPSKHLSNFSKLTVLVNEKSHPNVTETPIPIESVSREIVVGSRRYVGENSTTISCRIVALRLSYRNEVHTHRCTESRDCVHRIARVQSRTQRVVSGRVGNIVFRERASTGYVFHDYAYTGLVFANRRRTPPRGS